MSAKHSPGPWAQAGQRVNGPHGVLVAWCGEASSIDVAVGFYAVSKTEAEANARLIAAAPDLLAAVRAAHDYLSCIPESAAGGDDDAVRIARQCDAALARFIDVPGSASQSYHWPQVGRHPGSAG